jgi:hypothetical protein
MSDLISQGQTTLLIVAKIGIILFLIIYVVFSVIIIKQVRMMTETLNLGFEAQIKSVVFLHFVFSLGVLLLAIFIL